MSSVGAPYLYVEKWSKQDNRFVLEYFPDNLVEAFDQAQFLVEEYTPDQDNLVRIVSIPDRHNILYDPFNVVALIGEGFFLLDTNHKCILDTGEPLGVIIRKQLIEPNFSTIKIAAKELNIGRTGLSRVLNNKAALSIPLALRMEEKFGVEAELLLIMQVHKDVKEARKELVK